MKCITFQKPNIYHFFFLGYFIAMFSKEYLSYYLVENNKYKSGQLYGMYIYILSHLLSFIPYFISKYLSKRKIRVDDISNDDKTNNDLIKKYEGKYLYKQILIVSFFGFFSEAIFYIFYLINNNYTSVNSYSLGIYLILNTVVIYLVSYFVLKTYFYKHHYLSLFINSICFLVSILADIITIINLKIKEINYYIYIIITIIRLILLCFLSCFSKKVLESAFLSPYSIIAFRSIYETVYLVLFSIPLIFINIKEYNNNEDIIFKSFKQYLKGIKILYSILLLIDDYLLDLFTMFIIYKFSPSHLTLAMILESFVNLLYYIIRNNIKKKKVFWSDYVNFGLCLLLFIGSMIHNEIFITNKFGLNTKTQLYLNNEFNGEVSTIDDLSNKSNDDEQKDKKEMVLIGSNYIIEI